MNGEIPEALRGPRTPIDPTPEADFKYALGIPESTLEMSDSLPEADPADQVERHLDKHAGFFEASETLWAKVQVGIVAFTEHVNIPRVPSVVINEETGKPQRAFVELEHAGRNVKRFVANERMPNARQIIGGINRLTFEIIGVLTEELDETYEKLPHTSETVLKAGRAISDSSYDALQEAREEKQGKHRIFIEGMDEVQGPLEKAYFAAVVGQELVNRELEGMFVNDEVAPFFIERLTELAQDGQYGPEEYPGLLQAIATHVAEYGQRNCIAAAIERIAGTIYTKTDFIRDLLSEDAVRSGEKQNRDFVNSVLGAQAIAQVISNSSGDNGLTTEAIAEHVAEYFDELPEPWQKEYIARLRAQSVIKANAFAELVKPYERSGRRCSNIPHPYRTSALAKNSRRKKGSRPPQENDEAGLDVNDIVQEQARPESKFGILKHIGGSDKRFSIDIAELRELDDMMQHPLVVAFLEKHKSISGMADAVRESLEDIAMSPYQHSINVEKLRRQFSVNEVPSTQRRQNRMRRYRPKSTETPGNRQVGRLRITYGFFASDGAHIVGIEKIDLRDDTTYNV